MAASIGLLEARILIFGLLYLSYFTTDFDRVYCRLYDLINATRLLCCRPHNII